MEQKWSTNFCPEYSIPASRLQFARQIVDREFGVLAGDVDFARITIYSYLFTRIAAT
jgi:hypothetical protein